LTKTHCLNAHKYAAEIKLALLIQVTKTRNHPEISKCPSQQGEIDGSGITFMASEMVSRQSQYLRVVQAVSGK
jgi:hypothetical protein